MLLKNNAVELVSLESIRNKIFPNQFLKILDAQTAEKVQTWRLERSDFFERWKVEELKNLTRETFESLLQRKRRLLDDLTYII